MKRRKENADNGSDHHIRELYYGQGITNISSIAEMTGHNRKTVTKYIDMEDFSSC